MLNSLLALYANKPFVLLLLFDHVLIDADILDRSLNNSLFVYSDQLQDETCAIYLTITIAIHVNFIQVLRRRHTLCDIELISIH